MNEKRIPIFFACDDNFVKFTIVSIQSIKANASKEFDYHIHILCTKISEPMKKAALSLSDEKFLITFDDVSDYLKSVDYKLHTRDYYSKTTYFRLFIPEMFPQLDKALYIDSDTVVTGDVAELYNHDLGENYVGAAQEQAMIQVQPYGDYVEKCVGIKRDNYFNAGMLLINCRQFREKKLFERFIKLLHEYKFVAAQDEDYLNVICHNRVAWIEGNWNIEAFCKILYEPKDFKLIHYIMTAKPWHYKDCPCAEYFWKYAEQTPVYEQIKKTLEDYTDEERKNDSRIMEKLTETAVSEANREDNYLNRQKKYRAAREAQKANKKETGVQQSAERLAILEKIRQYEKEGRFGEDVENDIPARPIQVGEVDYEQKKISSRIKSHFAFKAARKFLKKQIDSRGIIIREIRGKENLSLLTGGTILTCNHFNAFDSFVIQLVYDEIHKIHRRGKFFRIINEANYTTFPGFYGYLMKNCNTLPLSSSHRTMNEFIRAVKALLAAGNFILIYPEQSLWWNYRKPKPLRKGAFTLAAKNNSAILPVFITMTDSDLVDDNGFFVQEYTINICRPIFPQKELSVQENITRMMSENYSAWKKVYEDFYQIPLKYDEDDE